MRKIKERFSFDSKTEICLFNLEILNLNHFGDNITVVVNENKNEAEVVVCSSDEELLKKFIKSIEKVYQNNHVEKDIK